MANDSDRAFLDGPWFHIFTYQVPLPLIPRPKASTISSETMMGRKAAVQIQYKCSTDAVQTQCCSNRTPDSHIIITITPPGTPSGPSLSLSHNYTITQLHPRPHLLYDTRAACGSLSRPVVHTCGSSPLYTGTAVSPSTGGHWGAPAATRRSRRGRPWLRPSPLA